jgi:coenzyme F420 hydrogenase subunit beta
MTADDLTSAIDRVVKNDNCTGCGACQLISARVTMSMDASGFLRPTVEVGAKALDREGHQNELSLFKRTCPGIGVRAPRRQYNEQHPIFGGYVSVWEAWATDDEIRNAGSSGGVLTALASWLVGSGKSSGVVGSRSDSLRPIRTVPIRITSREEAIAAAGSRYAPVCNLPLLRGGDTQSTALIGKPCEVSAAHQLFDARQTSERERPILLSFFCAGTPSQVATDSLVTGLGIAPEQVTALRYRGNGWPGSFEVRTDRVVRDMSYHESWGQHLGRELQWRCKLCVDGTGGHADIAVGDFWTADEKGFPTFEEQDGRSVAIARTRRGHEILLEAARSGVVHIEPLELDKVTPVQPLQAERKRALAGRLIGRALGGKRVPRYTGYNLLSLARKRPVRTLRTAVGTFVRTLRK